MGFVVCYNYGTVTDCVTSGQASATAANEGIISGCEAEGTVTATDLYLDHVYPGGIVGNNAGHVMNSYYTGSSNINIAGTNTGVVS